MFSVICTFGCRPDAIKMMPLVRELKSRPNIRTAVLSTDQHGDLLTPIFQYFDVFPDYDLRLMRPGQSLTELTASILQAVDPILTKESPDTAWQRIILRLPGRLCRIF